MLLCVGGLSGRLQEMALVEGDRWIDISVLKTDTRIVILAHIFVTRASHMFQSRNTSKKETELDGSS